MSLKWNQHCPGGGGGRGGLEMEGEREEGREGG